MSVVSSRTLIEVASRLMASGWMPACFSACSMRAWAAASICALLRAAVRLGALAAAVDADTYGRLDRFADAFGLAFQIRDDLLDIEGDSATLGKTAGKDTAQDKATFPSLLGIDASRARLAELRAEMSDALAPFGDRAGMLAVLGREAIERDR